MFAFHLTALDDDSLDEAAALVAREHDVARLVLPLLPSAWSDVAPLPAPRSPGSRPTGTSEPSHGAAVAASASCAVGPTV